MSDESSSEGFLGEELTRRQLLERLGVGGAAVVLPNVLTAPGSARAATTTGACHATGESCSLGIDPDVYRMPLTGEYIQTADRRICATKNWSAFPPEAFDIGFLRGFWPSVPTASQQATESAAFFFITTHWGPPDAPAADLNDVKTPADFPDEVFSSLASRTTRLEFDVPKTDFQKLGWTPAHLPVSIPADPAPDTPLKLRGWYIKGDGVARSDEERAAARAGKGRATREHPLVILSSGFPYSIAFDQRVGGIDVGRQIRKTATYLVAQGFDVLFFDKRGHGYSEGLLDGMGEDIFRALDLLEHGVTVEEGVPLSLSVITADGRRLSGVAAAAERLLGSRYTARTKPIVLRGFSYGSSQLQKAMAINYSDLPVEYRFKRDESGAVVVDEARMPAGNRRYNFRGIVAISGFQGSLKYETAPYFLALDALASTIGHNGGVLKSTVYQSMDRWPAHLGLYATNDFETADGAVPREARVQRFCFSHSTVQSTPTMRNMGFNSQIPPGPNGPPTPTGEFRVLKNGAAAHQFTREDRAKGGRIRAEKMRRRKQLRERFEVAEIEDLALAELELLDPALLRLNLLLASDDDRVALRAAIEVFDRTLGRPRQQPAYTPSFDQRDMDAALARAREKLAVRLERDSADGVTSG